MKAKIIALTVYIIVGFVSPTFAQNSNTKETKPDEEESFDLFDEDLSEFTVMKIEDVRFKIEDFEGNDVTNDVRALKAPNNLDLLFYDMVTDVTCICYNFYSAETKNNEWLFCDLVPESSTGLYWILSNNYKSFYIIQFGISLDMTNFKLKASLNPGEYIVQENGVDKYVMKDLKGKNLDEFYPLELLNQ
jgi:hypothetical protein